MSPSRRNPTPDQPAGEAPVTDVPAAPPAHTGPGALRRTLTDPAGWATIVELVPWAGELSDARGATQLKAAQDLAGDPRITAMSNFRMSPIPQAPESPGGGALPGVWVVTPMKRALPLLTRAARAASTSRTSSSAPTPA